MKYILKFSIVLIYVFWIYHQVSAYKYTPEQLSNKINNYVNTKVDIVDRFPVYNKIREKISKKITAIDRSQTKKRQYLKDLIYYNNNHILNLVEYITSRKWAQERFDFWKQQAIDKLISESIQVKEKLKTLGYPSIDDTNGILTKAKSFVSCASGKMKWFCLQL